MDSQCVLSGAYQAEDEELDELGIEEVKDVREFIREVPLFQGMIQAEEVEGEWGFIEGTCRRLSTVSARFLYCTGLTGCLDEFCLPASPMLRPLNR